MRLFILIMGFVLVGNVSAMAQEIAQGDTCTAGEENFIIRSGGPETGGVTRILRCDGTRWVAEFLTLKGPSGMVDVVIGTGVHHPNFDTENKANSFTPDVFIGYLAGQNYDPVYTLGQNVVVGGRAGAEVTSGSNNTLIGYSAGGSMTTGNYNTIIGSRAGSNVTGGSSNILIGGVLPPVITPTANTNNYLNIGNVIFGDITNRATDGSGTARIGINIPSPDAELDVSGSIEFTGTIRDMSDRRQKTDILVLTDALSAVSKIDGVSFKMKDGDGSTELGLIAQDVEAVYPELVYTNDDGIKALNYQGMIGPLVEAVKELDAQNATLRAELKAKDSELARMIHEIGNRMDVIEGKRRPPLKPYNQ